MNSKTKVTKQDIERAFDLFDKNKIPENVTRKKKAKKYFIIAPNGKLYPAVFIHDIATSKYGYSMRHKAQIKDIERLDFTVVNLKMTGASDAIYKAAATLNTLTLSQLKKLAAEKPKKPKSNIVKRKEYVRNLYVVAIVLKRANGKCEKCTDDAPFDRKTTGEPYLEVHHKKRLADGGEDTVKNAIALCPNCHREAHYG